MNRPKFKFNGMSGSFCSSSFSLVLYVIECVWCVLIPNAVAKYVYNWDDFFTSVLFQNLQCHFNMLCVWDICYDCTNILSQMEAFSSSCLLFVTPIISHGNLRSVISQTVDAFATMMCQRCRSSALSAAEIIIETE